MPTEGRKAATQNFAKFSKTSKRLNLFVEYIVAKLLRANGGCLGVK